MFKEAESLAQKLVCSNPGLSRFKTHTLHPSGSRKPADCPVWTTFCVRPQPHPGRSLLVCMQGSALWKIKWSSGSQAGSSGSEDFPLSYSFQVTIPSSLGCILGLILSLQEERTPTMGNGHILKPVSHYTHTHTHTHPTPMQTAKSFSGSLSALV